jgi:hypothetical protein
MDVTGVAQPLVTSAPGFSVFGSRHSRDAIYHAVENERVTHLTLPYGFTGNGDFAAIGGSLTLLVPCRNCAFYNSAPRLAHVTIPSTLVIAGTTRSTDVWT